MLKTYLLKKVRSISQIILLVVALFGFVTLFSNPAFAYMQKGRPATTQNTLPLVVANRFDIDPDKRELFLELATAAIEPTRAEPGCISYGFYEQPSARNSFLYYEEWKDSQALSAHLKKPYVQPLFAKFSEILNGSLVVKVYTTKSIATELPA